MSAETDTLNMRDTSSNTRLSGWRLKLGWAIWIAAAILSCITLLGTIPQFLTEARYGGPLTEYNLRNGLSPSLYFPIEISLNVIQLTIWYVSAVFIVIKKRDDWMALTTSVMILTNGYFDASFNQVLRHGQLSGQLIALDSLVWLLDIVNYASAIMFCGYFPDGRFSQRWLKLIYFGLFSYLTVDDLIIVFTNPNIRMYSDFSGFVRFFVVCALLIYAQLNHLRNSAAVQRQQTKLAVIGLVLGVIANVVRFMDKLLLPQFGQTSYLVLRPVSFLLYVCAVVCFMYAILRYHLWDIDFVINRSLVYGGLTALLGAFFVGGFFALRTIMETVFGNQQDLIAIAVPAVVITALFAPTRNWLQRYIDHRFYGIEIDYKKAVEVERAWRQKQGTDSGGAKTSFGEYTGLELIGHGGMGEIYRAKHPKMDRYVAIKILPKYLAEDEAALRRYNHEAQAIAQLKHPNIVGMYDYGVLDGMPYIVLEYIDGRTLSDELNRRGCLPLAEALPLLSEVASALDHVHAAGIIHRDIKPSNVMIEHVTESKRNPRAVLMDFGIAKLYSSLTQLTGTGVLVGTLDYVSPEQIQGASEVDVRADIYSFGVMTYQVLTGALPFKHKNMTAQLMAHLIQPAPDPREIAPDLPEAAGRAIMRAMAKEPRERQETAVDFVFEMAGRKAK